MVDWRHIRPIWPSMVWPHLDQKIGGREHRWAQDCICRGLAEHYRARHLNALEVAVRFKPLSQPGQARDSFENISAIILLTFLCTACTELRPVLFEIKSVSQHWPIGQPPKHAGLIGPAMWPPAPAILSAAHCTALHCTALQQKVDRAKQSREGKGWNGCHPEMKVERRKAFELWPSF